MGSPQKPSAEQYAELEKAGKLAQAGEAKVVKVDGDKVTVNVGLARQAVVLLVLE